MTSNNQSNPWNARQAFTLALVCLLLGTVVGYFAHGPNSPKAPVAVAAAVTPAGAMPPSQPNAMVQPISTPAPSLEQMKAASQKAAVPLLEKLKTDPKNFKLLVQAGEMYYHHGAFEEAGSYYLRALNVQDNAALRNQYASTLYYRQKTDEALQQYSLVLTKDPKNDIALFNSGMLLFKEKKDSKGAIDCWQKILKAYPNHPQRQRVQAMIDKASQPQLQPQG